MFGDTDEDQRGTARNGCICIWKMDSGQIPHPFLPVPSGDTAT